jgi:hypothetical protein
MSNLIASPNLALMKQKPKPSSHGGKRKGAGRKPKTLKALLKGLPRVNADLILQEVDANQKYKELACSRDERLRFEVLKYLTDRACGKAGTVAPSDGQVDVKVIIDL